MVSTGLDLPRALRIGFASDFHAGPCTHPTHLELACRTLAESQPDVLLLGGDFVCLHAGAGAELAARLADVPAPLGRFAVLGNHDLWAGAAAVARALEAAGIHVLINENARLPRPFAEVSVCGLADPISGHPDPVPTLAGAEGHRIVLMHAPSGVGSLAGERWDVAFCGHTHGGQVALPGGRPLHIPEAPEYQGYYQGRYSTPGGPLFVTRGVGYSTLPIRTFCPPEIVAAQLDFVPVRAPRPEGASARSEEGIAAQGAELR